MEVIEHELLDIESLVETEIAEGVPIQILSNIAAAAGAQSIARTFLTGYISLMEEEDAGVICDSTTASMSTNSDSIARTIVEVHHSQLVNTAAEVCLSPAGSWKYLNY